MVQRNVGCSNNRTKMRDKYSMPSHPYSREDAGELALYPYVQICFFFYLTDKCAIKLFPKLKSPAGEVPHMAKLDIVWILAFAFSKKIFSFVTDNSYDNRDNFFHREGVLALSLPK